MRAQIISGELDRIRKFNQFSGEHDFSRGGWGGGATYRWLRRIKTGFAENAADARDGV